MLHRMRMLQTAFTEIMAVRLCISAIAGGPWGELCVCVRVRACVRACVCIVGMSVVGLVYMF